jgi:quercetin dioxygenase-like cupin family protein
MEVLMSDYEYPALTFDRPTLVRYGATLKHVWGDDISGQTTDWVYISTEEVSQIVFGMPVGGHFGHSEDFKDVYDSDIIWRVLSGVLVVVNPETGEVHRAAAGEALFFHGDIWHYGYSYGREPVRVLEFSAPSAIQSVRHAVKKPPIANPRYAQDELLGRWPEGREEAESRSTVLVLREEDVHWRMEGERTHVLVGHLVSTRYLTVGEVHLLPGQQSDVYAHDGIKTLYVLEGRLNVQLPEEESWIEADAADGVYLPAGVSHRFLNFTTEPTRALFQIVPSESAAT